MSRSREQASRDFLARQRAALDPDALLQGVLAGERKALAQALTLVESEKAEHRALAQSLVEACLQRPGPRAETLRIGITGVPGVGKSTFIEALGLLMLEAGHRVAVQAVDPSSEISGGSILGDKTRMEKLSAAEAAFIRPSPARGTLGGVADRTREHILLYEAAGYDRVIIETVGVGQSETAVHGMVDCFVLLLIPGAGDELQGIKRGIVEMADLLVVNKCDADNQTRAKQTQRDYEQALHLFPPPSTGWSPPVLRCSALSGEGMKEVLERMEGFREFMNSSGALAERRQRQARTWLHDAIRDALSEAFYSNDQVNAALQDEEARVLDGAVHPLQAAARLLALYRGA